MSSGRESPAPDLDVYSAHESPPPDLVVSSGHDSPLAAHQSPSLIKES